MSAKVVAQAWAAMERERRREAVVKDQVKQMQKYIKGRRGK